MSMLPLVPRYADNTGTPTSSISQMMNTPELCFRIAMDACMVDTFGLRKRVSVDIEKVNLEKVNHQRNQGDCEMMRIVVLDNGCGMENISECVGAEGRLAWCLLHARRLVPNSVTTIRSATHHQKDWTSTRVAIDLDSQSVTCLQLNKRKRKDLGYESGTSIQFLLPVSSALHR